MTRARVLRVLFTLAFVGALLGAAPAVLAADPTFGEPSAMAPLGQPITLRSHIDGVGAGSVDVLVRRAGADANVAIAATSSGSAGGWQATQAIDVAAAADCTCPAAGNSAPNTQVEFQFRVRAPDGTETLGPVGHVTVEDDRFQWRSIDQDLVRVHWYEGDEAFARAAADVANDAIDRAAGVMGKTLPEPVDLFVYSTQDALLGAVSANRENIAGEAHSSIGTMFVWLPPNDASRNEVVVAHELTHLVFNEVTANDYHSPPRWLNEGIAVLLSEGYSAGDQVTVASAVRNGTLIPIQGLVGQFPSTQDGFFLAYAEAVGAVDFFTKRYGEQALWDLVRSYAAGQSDDDAFMNATGGDMAAFNADWFAYLGLQVPDPLGPQPAQPGPVPSSWDVEPIATFPPATPRPSSLPPSTGPGGTPFPARSVPPLGNPPSAPSRGGESFFNGLAIGSILFVVVIGLVLVLRFARPRQPPPPPPPPPWWNQPGPPSGPPPAPPSVPPAAPPSGPPPAPPYTHV